MTRCLSPGVLAHGAASDSACTACPVHSLTLPSPPLARWHAGGLHIWFTAHAAMHDKMIMIVFANISCSIRVTLFILICLSDYFCRN